MEIGFLLRYHGLSQLIGLPFIAKSVKEWTAKEVLDFLEAGNLGGHKEIFYKNKIKGKDMATLSDQELREDLRMKMGDRKRLLNYINFLNELENHKQGNSKLLNKTPKKSKAHNYKLRSNKELKKVLKSVKNHPVFQQRIEEEESDYSSRESQKYTTGAKLKLDGDSSSSDSREYGSEALEKNHHSSRQSSLEEIFTEGKSDQSSENICDTTQRRPSIVGKISNESQEENHGSTLAAPVNNRMNNGNHFHPHNNAHHPAHHHSLEGQK